MIPETGEVTRGEIKAPMPSSGTMDALTKGTLQGVDLLLSIVAMLIVLVAAVHLINLILGFLPRIGSKPITLQMILGYIMAPVVWLTGIEWSQAQTAGALMGTKTVLNEFIAYLELSRLPADALSERSRLIITYAMCGFANPGSLGIMIGGLGGHGPGPAGGNRCPGPQIHCGRDIGHPHDRLRGGHLDFLRLVRAPQGFSILK